ncbi:hypothetical protein VC83_01723 [Pseudogymnoascus destructans]|uniref:Uncharacterized protein n=1 Tax=Pseudogymnoascus destructans TaxID=655981 RepID=A0A177AIT2_9PEZI|nr:uncharacterized protein VC83_01723 [Pseudogymnoascus destructans]OAF61977.1 hypothetical protein VC83_01723 [Pseudogymnoascus destructans]
MSERASRSSRGKAEGAGSSRQNLSAAHKRRMADRASQRAGRERTNNHIRHLEKPVESLQKLCKSIEHPDETRTRARSSSSPGVAFKTSMEPGLHQQPLHTGTAAADMRPSFPVHEGQPESWWHQIGLSEMEGIHQVPINPVLFSMDPLLPNPNSPIQAQSPIQTLHTVPRPFPALFG